ncbi:ribosomal protein S18-alanine N-acetyltransferase [Caldimonas sp. KR1-144]|uniref:ribosomal protein S18-alanine N-acetyltransferase n=1 Tax=Caldimonas sp. KR1-144 TaxID=3400911 RepID=UPI003C00B130
MSALPRERDLPERRFEPVDAERLDAVLAIEVQAYDFPWTRGNFLDSQRAGYLVRAAMAGDTLVGYCVAMQGVDEMHLLNLTVAPAEQGRGHARWMLDALRAEAAARRLTQLWLEVRLSNERARRLYEQYGFRSVGLRRGYYPARARAREDAVVMSLAIPEAIHGLG